jgi:hypothetical protein
MVLMLTFVVVVGVVVVVVVGDVDAPFLRSRHLSNLLSGTTTTDKPSEHK